MAMPPRYMPETSSGIRGLRAARQEGPPPPPPPPPPPSLTPPSSVAGQFLPDLDIVPNKVSLSLPEGFARRLDVRILFLIKSLSLPLSLSLPEGFARRLVVRPRRRLTASAAIRLHNIVREHIV